MVNGIQISPALAFTNVLAMDNIGKVDGSKADPAIALVNLQELPYYLKLQENR
jgi:hypothetical protein